MGRIWNIFISFESAHLKSIFISFVEWRSMSVMYVCWPWKLLMFECEGSTSAEDNLITMLGTCDTGLRLHEDLPRIFWAHHDLCMASVNCMPNKFLKLEFEFCVLWWHLVSGRYSVSCMTILFFYTWKVYQIRHQSTRKVNCLPGDSRWPLFLPQEFVWICIG